MDHNTRPVAGKLGGGEGWILIRDPADLELVRVVLGASPRLGLDLETTGLDPRADRIRLLTVSIAPGRAPWVVFMMDCGLVDPSPLFEVMARKELVGHNLAFDLGFLARLGFTPGAVRDTMLASQVLASGDLMSQKLGDTADRELGRNLDKSLQTSDWTGPLTLAQLAYAAADAEVLLPLADALDVKLAAAGLTGATQIEMDCLSAMVWLAGSGASIDSAAWLSLADQARQEADRLAEVLDAMAPPPQAELFTGRVCRWNSPAKVQAIFEGLGVPLTGTDDRSLAGVRHPLAKSLRAYRAAAKAASTYGPDWLDYVASDGRVYPCWRQIGAASGRMSCSSPNMQQLPRGKAYRRCVQAPPGRMLVKADFSQIELRIAARISADPVMLRAYTDGADLHTLTAQRVLGKTDVSPADRQIAKVLNFGLLFGMGAAGFRAYAMGNYGIEMTEQQAEEYREGFFRAYPGLRRWFQKVRDQHAMETRSLAGRRRWVPYDESDTIRLNSPVQGTGVDGLKRALGLLWKRRDQAPGAFPILVCHDEIVVECDVDQVDLASAWLRRAMVDGMEALIDPIPVAVDVTWGPTWAG